MILQFRNRIFSILDNIAFIISLIYMLLKFRLIFAFDTQTKVYSINFILNLQIRSKLIFPFKLFKLFFGLV